MATTNGQRALSLDQFDMMDPMPPMPPEMKTKIYAKSDGFIYWMSDSGVEMMIAAVGDIVTINQLTATPAAPMTAGQTLVYAKSDGNIYYQGFDAIEHLVPNANPTTGIINAPSGIDVRIANGKLAAAFPNSYPLGLSTASVLVSNGWPDGGVVITNVQEIAANYVSQILISRTTGFIYVRASTSATSWTTAFAQLQPGDATLTALAAYNANGLLVQTAANTFVARSIAVDTTMATPINPLGTAGNPTLGVNDTGAVTAGFTANTGGSWAINTASYHIVAGLLCHLHIQATYSGTTITGPANGNIGNTVVISVIPAACRPNRDMRFMYAVGSASCGSAAVSAAGAVQIESLLPTATISSGDIVTLDCVYALST